MVERNAKCPGACIWCSILNCDVLICLDLNDTFIIRNKTQHLRKSHFFHPVMVVI